MTGDDALKSELQRAARKAAMSASVQRSALAYLNLVLHEAPRGHRPVYPDVTAKKAFGVEPRARGLVDSSKRECAVSANVLRDRLEELQALTFAVELLGVSAARLKAIGMRPREHYLEVLALRSAAVVFDPARVDDFAPAMPESQRAGVQATLDSILMN